MLSTVRDYLSYPVMTKVSVREEVNLDFPAVTICNLNRVNCENLRGTIQVRFLHDLTNVCTIPL